MHQKILHTNEVAHIVFVQAIEEYGDVDVFISNFRPLRATLSGLPDRVLMKLIVCATTNKVVGVHMCGDDAPEIIQVCMILYFSSTLLLYARRLMWRALYDFLAGNCNRC
jgi:pyruvate/2-oxoglutarate dehydrogenase complex dihydrolipoamide dehydrogenase (E3) component